MWSEFSRSPANLNSRERRRNRIRAPFGDEDIPIVFAGPGLRELFHRRLSANRSTALIFDDRMLLHKDEWHESYAERPDRLQVITDRCRSYNILQRCLLLTPEPAGNELLSYIHSSSHIDQMIQTETMSDEERKRLASTLDSVFLNQHTNLAARLAVGSVVQAIDSVHRDDARNAFCLIRPPGHHAMEDEACGFCIYNNVAIGAHHALNQLEYNRVLIIDWDVHHGQGTQYEFYDSSRVLYISIHRYDNQQFWPNLRESNFDFIGSGRGRGYNINIPLNETNVGDADYLEIFHQLILPVAFEFDPDLVLVSAGYDCAFGCPLGQLGVTPSLFAHLTHKLMCLAEGRLVMVLEGGYYPDSLAEGVAHTISALLGDPMPSLEILDQVHPSVLQTISDCITLLRFRWRSLHMANPSEHANLPDTQHLPLRSWSDVKVPNMEPEAHTHAPEDIPRIDAKLSELKSAHPVMCRATGNPSTCIVYDSRMENHKNEDDRNHPETPHRIRRAYEFLDEYGLARRCRRVEARLATQSELLRVHTEQYVNSLAQTANLDQNRLNEMSDEVDSVFYNRHTYDCARLAAGSVLAVVDEVCTGRSLNGVAVIRPPGHHASADRSMGFCFFNNVAIAARHAQQIHGLQRIAIMDWDVHHGNGTAKIFENDPNVLYLSVHRHDDGRFFPSCSDASPTMCGTNDGLGRTVQVGWNGRHIKDGEYISVFLQLFLPILYEFRPQLTIVSAGFDAVRGDRLGGLGVSIECFAHLTHLLLTSANLCSPPNSPYSDEKQDSYSERTTRQRSAQQQQQQSFSSGLILALEGGYHLSATAEALCQSVASLLGDCCPRLSTGIAPSDKGCRAIRRAMVIQQPFWKSVHIYGPVVSPDRTNEPNRTPASDQRLTRSQVAQLSVSAQLEADLQSRLEDLSLSDRATPIVQTSHIVTQPVVSVPISDPVTWRNNLSTSTSVAARLPPTVEQETLQDLGTDIFTSISVNQLLSTTNILSTSSASLPAPTTTPPLPDEVTHPRGTGSITGQSERSSLDSEISPIVHQRSTAIPLNAAAGASGSAEEQQVPTSSAVNNHVVAVATLQDLMHVTSMATEDIHAFFGLQSTQQLPERLFAVTPLTWCPHLTSVQSNPDWRPNIEEPCRRCTNQDENWVCLTCFSVFCSRYANSHMIEHYTTSRHPLVLSFADLSSWCYGCEAYVHHETLSGAKQAAHRAKFGLDLPE